jgi:hypothetical protein
VPNQHITTCTLTTTITQKLDNKHKIGSRALLFCINWSYKNHAHLLEHTSQYCFCNISVNISGNIKLCHDPLPFVLPSSLSGLSEAANAEDNAIPVQTMDLQSLGWAPCCPENGLAMPSQSRECHSRKDAHGWQQRYAWTPASRRGMHCVLPVWRTQPCKPPV